MHHSSTNYFFVGRNYFFRVETTPNFRHFKNMPYFGKGNPLCNNYEREDFVRGHCTMNAFHPAIHGNCRSCVSTHPHLCPELDKIWQRDEGCRQCGRSFKSMYYMCWHCESCFHPECHETECSFDIVAGIDSHYCAACGAWMAQGNVFDT